MPRGVLQDTIIIKYAIEVYEALKLLKEEGQDLQKLNLLQFVSRCFEMGFSTLQRHTSEAYKFASVSDYLGTLKPGNTVPRDKKIVLTSDMVVSIRNFIGLRAAHGQSSTIAMIKTHLESKGFHVGCEKTFTKVLKEAGFRWGRNPKKCMAIEEKMTLVTQRNLFGEKLLGLAMSDRRNDLVF